MSNSPTPATTETTTPGQSGAPDRSEATLVHLDPATLVIETNVRADARLDAGFVASIAERGVVVPVVAHRREDGAVAVIYGQRRTLAAVQVERPTIPVYLVASPAQADRLIDQMGENEHRAPLTTSERVMVFAELKGLGMSARTIAKRTSTRPAVVKAALTTAASEVAVEAVSACQALTLDQACVLAEFDTDPEVVEALLSSLPSGTFDHIAQRARDARALREQGEKITADLTAAGVAVIEAPQVGDVAKRLNHLRDDQGYLDPEGHAQCPGHAAYVESKTTSVHHPRDEQGAYVDPTRVEVMQAVYVCREPATYGHHDPFAPSGPERIKAADMDPAQRQAAAAAARHVKDSNLAWTSARTVRRTWLAGFAKRKAAPKEAATFIATALAADTTMLAREASHRHALACDLLGITAPPGWNPLVVTDERTSPARAQVIALVFVLAAYDNAMTANDWREVRATTAAYLEWIAARGYTLADVEHRACGHTPQPDQADEQVDQDEQPIEVDQDEEVDQEQVEPDQPTD